jgi:adenosylhomocysteine nucleosidase
MPLASIIEPRVLVLAPLAEESILLRAFRMRQSANMLPGLKVPCAYIAKWRLALAQSGPGKAQSAVQAQYMIGQFRSASLVACVGAAGSLDPALSVGDVVVATETVEHDFRLLFATRPLPRFPADASALGLLRDAAIGIAGFHTRFDVIASGDEDVVSPSRAADIRAQIGAICVAWEGSGIARPAALNGIGSLEIRGVTDAADNEAPQDFRRNLPIALQNVFRLLEALQAE